MEDLGQSLDKLIKAGIGAVTEGLSRTQDMVDKLSEKGEPLYNQACDTVSETAEKIRKSVKSSLDGTETMDEIKHSIASLARSQLFEIADYIRELIGLADEEDVSESCGDRAEEDIEDDEDVMTDDEADVTDEEEHPAGEEEEHFKAKDSHPDDDIFGND